MQLLGRKIIIARKRKNTYLTGFPPEKYGRKGVIKRVKRKNRKTKKILMFFQSRETFTEIGEIRGIRVG